MIGLIVGVLTFLIIGLFHPIVIKTEYHIGSKAWPAFAVAGCWTAWRALCARRQFLSVMFGIISCSFFWSIRELKEQEERVEKGWYPSKPTRRQ